MKKYFILLSIIILTGYKEPFSNKIAGTWRLVHIMNLSENSIDTSQNTHYIITNQYIMSIGGDANRASIPKNFSQMNCEEILTQLPAGGGFSKYKIVEDTIIRTTIFAMSAHYIGKSIKSKFLIKDDTLVFRDNHLMDGYIREWTFVRLENL